MARTSSLARRLVASIRAELRTSPAGHLVGAVDPAELASRLEAGDPSAAQAVLGLIWGRGEPTPEWWRGELGRVVARALPVGDTTAVSRQHAAEMLGWRDHGSVSALVARGKVCRALPGGPGTGERRPVAGVIRADILALLVGAEPRHDLHAGPPGPRRDGARNRER